MKILMVNEHGYEEGGAETYLINLKHGLEKKNHQVKIVTPEVIKGNQFSDYTFRRINKKSPLRLFPYIWNHDAYKKLQSAIFAFKPDIIHLHFIHYNTSVSVLSPIKNIPTVYTMHGHELMSPMGLTMTDKCNHLVEDYCLHCFGYSRYIPEILKRWLMKYFSKNINLFIAPSKHHHALLKEYKYNPSLQVYNGIKLSAFSPNPHNKSILFVGRLVKDKGIMVAIEAMKYVAKNFPDAKLIVVGQSSKEDEIKLHRLVKDNNLTKSVTFVGKVDNHDVFTYYKNASLVIVPSIYPDNLPTVIIEAMSAERPVIGSLIGGIPELIDNNKTGYLVKPNEPKELAEKIMRLLSNKELINRFGYHARKKAESAFSIDKHIEKIEEIYKKLIG